MCTESCTKPLSTTLSRYQSFRVQDAANISLRSTDCTMVYEWTNGLDSWASGLESFHCHGLIILTCLYKSHMIIQLREHSEITWSFFDPSSTPPVILCDLSVTPPPRSRNIWMTSIGCFFTGPQDLWFLLMYFWYLYKTVQFTVKSMISRINI